MSEYKFSCPACGQHILGDVRYAGTPLKCPACQADFVVPPPSPPGQLRIDVPRRVAAPGAAAQSAPVSRAATVPVPAAAVAPVQGQAPKTSGLAIASLVLSLLTLLIGPFGFIPGIICGHIARAKIANNPNLKGSGLAKAGLIIGYIFLGLGILAIVFFLVAWMKLRSAVSP